MNRRKGNTGGASYLRGIINFTIDDVESTRRRSLDVAISKVVRGTWVNVCPADLSGRATNVDVGECVDRARSGYSGPPRQSSSLLHVIMQLAPKADKTAFISVLAFN